MNDNMYEKMVLEDIGLTDRLHAEREECSRRARAWMTANQGFRGLVSDRKVAAWNFGDLGAAMYPDVPVEYAALCAHLTNWIAVVDDAVEDAPDRVEELRAALLGQPGEGDGSDAALVEAWGEIAHILTRETPPAFHARVRDALRALFDAYAWEAQYRKEGRVPSLAEFFEHRPDTAGMTIYLLVLERAVDGPLEESALAAPWFPVLNQLVGNLACWANDLLSFEWDRDLGNPISLVRVLTRDDEQPGYEAAWKKFHETWNQMQRARAEALVDAPPKARAYLERLPEIVTGVFVWMRLTRRYTAAARA